MARKRNDLYQLVRGYLANQPAATPAEVWNHFEFLAQHGLCALLVGVDGGVMEFIPNPSRTASKRVTRSAFVRQVLNIRKELESEISHQAPSMTG